MELDLVDRATPFLMVDLETVRTAYSSLRAALPGFKIHYAMKANPQPEIIEALARCGSSFEVASGAELQTLLDSGIDTRDVIFSKPRKGTS
jgi:ornithine decarboxylase